MIYVTVLIISRGNPPLCAVWTANNYRFWKEFKENNLPLLWTSCFYLFTSTSGAAARFWHSSLCQDLHTKYLFILFLVFAVQYCNRAPDTLKKKNQTNKTHRKNQKETKKKNPKRTFPRHTHTLVLQKDLNTSKLVQFWRNKWSRETTAQLPWHFRRLVLPVGMPDTAWKWQGKGRCCRPLCRGKA